MAAKRVVVIGSGFAGLSTAALLAKDGHQVTVLEKNNEPGGRARLWQHNGFSFDMGPSWYWMPEVFENFYNSFGKTTADFYELKRLDPSYRIYYKQDALDVPASVEDLIQLFEQREAGSGNKLRAFLADAEYKYKTAMQDYVFRVSDSVTEFMDIKLLVKSFQLQLFQSIRGEIRSRFKNPELVSLLEFPVLFLGSTPGRTPAMYSMMNYADLVLGTWYPMGGMVQIVNAFLKLATDNGAQILLGHEATRIEIQKGRARQVHTNKGMFEADLVVCGGDYNYCEQHLLEEKYRTYSSSYWQKRTMSPSSLIFYLGINKKLKNLLHHNLFFDSDFEQHAREIYDVPRWPTDPLFYVCAASKTDSTVAPEGCENVFVLMPLAPGITDTEATREAYFRQIIRRIEKRIGEPVLEHIVVNRSYCINDFEKDYHSFKGNAYGLANTLAQTAILKPKMISPKVSNLFFAGQLTVPGPGVPPAIISGQIVANQIQNRITNNQL